MPNHIETILNHIHFERRQDASTFEPLINEYFNSDKLDTTAKAFLTVQYAKHAQQVRLYHCRYIKIYLSYEKRLEWGKR